MPTFLVSIVRVAFLLLGQAHERLKGQCHDIFDFWFFYESGSPNPLSVPLGPYRIFSKIRRNIRSSRCTTATGVCDSVANGKNLKSYKFYLFVWTPLGSRVNLYIFAFKFTLKGHGNVADFLGFLQRSLTRSGFWL